MAAPFKKTTTQYVTTEGKRCAPGTPGAIRRDITSKKYYGLVPRADGRRQAVPLAPDYKKSVVMLNKLLTDAAMRVHGVADQHGDHAKVPLLTHLDDYQRELESRNNASEYVSVVISRLTNLLNSCQFVYTADFSASRAADWLGQIRRQGRARAALPAGQKQFKRAEVAALLGIKPGSVSAALRRARLIGEGNGKARRLSRDTVEALQDRLCVGASVATSNQYLTHLKGFCNWLVSDRRMRDNPFAHLEAGNAAVDRRHDRRELTPDELDRLHVTTRASARMCRGLNGEDRFVLYLLACSSGFRASALASLTPAHFELDAQTPVVALSARRNKSRVTRIQPLPSEVVGVLRGYLAGRPAGAVIWGGTWATHRKGGAMMRLDLEDAGIAYAVQGPDGPLFADFHALRHTYITGLGRAGVDLRTAQELAGHSSPVLTAKYSHRRLHDLAGAVGKMPGLIPDHRPASGSNSGPDGSTVAQKK